MRARATATHAAPRPGDRRRAQAELIERLRERRAEIEQATLARVYGLASPSQSADPQYLDGLRSAVAAALDYGFTALEQGGRAPPIPPALLVQARLAARNAVSLETVLRRYCSGNTLFADFLIEAAEAASFPRRELKRLLRALAAAFDALLAAIGEEYGREAESKPASSEQRRLNLIGRLLAGELADASELSYELEGFHLAVLGVGSNLEPCLRELARNLDCRLLHARPDERTHWAWLGGRQKPDPAELTTSLAGSSANFALALGEPGQGLSGWRLSHRQAAAALPVAQHGPEAVVRYGEVALLAAILQDDLLATSLREMYLEPLAKQRDGGEAARETLRAYFGAGRNVASAAAVLGVSRQAANSRLRRIENSLGRSLGDCAVELEAALWVELFEPLA